MLDPSAEGVERRDPDSVGLGWLIVVCSSFTVVGVVLMALVDGEFDLTSVWPWWGSAAGRATTVISAVDGLLGIWDCCRFG